MSKNYKFTEHIKLLNVINKDLTSISIQDFLGLILACNFIFIDLFQIHKVVSNLE